MTDPSGPAKMPAIARDSALGRGNALEPTRVQPSSTEARCRASIALIFHEAGLEPTEEMLARLSGAMLSLGLAIRPIVTRW